MSRVLAATVSVGELEKQRMLYNVASCWLYLKECSFVTVPFSLALSGLNQMICKVLYYVVLFISICIDV
jgi:hypothetical protein